MISYQPLYKHLDLSADEIKTRSTIFLVKIFIVTSNVAAVHRFMSSWI